MTKLKIVFLFAPVWNKTKTKKIFSCIFFVFCNC